MAEMRGGFCLTEELAENMYVIFRHLILLTL